MAEQGPLSGKVLGDKYLLGDLLGVGGFGAVYSARHLLLDRPQAIKLLLDRHLSQPAFRERFLREARALATLDHPHIVHIDDFVSDEQETSAYLVMPFVAEGTFRDFLRKRRQPLSLDEVGRYLEQICQALDYAHQHGVVHLDLKPQNLLVHADGRLLLSDFGLAHLVKQEVVEGGSSLYHGSPHYMAPEHFRGKPERGSDIYALGVILYEMLAGSRPFEGPTPESIMLKHITEPPPTLRSFRPEISEEMEEIIRRVLTKQVTQRYQKAEALLAAFKDVLTNQQRRLDQEEEFRRLQRERQYLQELDRMRRENELQVRLHLETEALLQKEKEAHQQALVRVYEEAEKQTEKLLNQQKRRFEDLIAHVDAAGNKLLFEEQQKRQEGEEQYRQEVARYELTIQDLQRRLSGEVQIRQEVAKYPQDKINGVVPARLFSSKKAISQERSEGFPGNPTWPSSERDLIVSDGSDLLGQNDPRSADIGILYVRPGCSRQEILTAITAEEVQGRKQIVVVLPDQGKAFRQSVEFDGLKNMRRSLKAQLIFIALPGPGPAVFARQRRFVVYSSLETFKTALRNERSPLNPPARRTPGKQRRAEILTRSQANSPRMKPLAPLMTARPMEEFSLDDDEGLAPPMAPRPPAGGAGSDGSARSGRMEWLSRPGPTPLVLGQRTTPPRSGGSSKLPAASAGGSQTRNGTSKPLAAPGHSSKPLSPAQGNLNRDQGVLSIDEISVIERLQPNPDRLDMPDISK